MATLRLPLLAFGSLAARLRRLPGAATIARHASLVVATLLTLAFLALLVWGLERAPQRVGLADLASGALSPMQSWIIVSGDLKAEESRISTFRYQLTDRAVPNATMTVFSEIELPVGPATVSGTYIGPREPVPPGTRWIGQMRADAVQVADQPPPWVAIALTALALTVVAAHRAPYPVFFGGAPASTTPRPMAVPVRVRHGPLTKDAEAVRGTFRVEPGAGVSLNMADGRMRALRLHSVHTGADVGELHHVSRTVPALRVRQSTDELIITFDNPDDRDVAAAALRADAAGWRGKLSAEST